jgi:hypothetical protein
MINKILFFYAFLSKTNKEPKTQSSMAQRSIPKYPAGYHETPSSKKRSTSRGPPATPNDDWYYRRLAHIYETLSVIDTTKHKRGSGADEIALGKSIDMYVSSTPGRKSKLHTAARQLRGMGSTRIKGLKGDNYNAFIEKLPDEEDGDTTLATEHIKRHAPKTLEFLTPLTTKKAWGTSKSTQLRAHPPTSAPPDATTKEQKDRIVRNLFGSATGSPPENPLKLPPIQPPEAKYLVPETPQSSEVPVLPPAGAVPLNDPISPDDIEMEYEDKASEAEPKKLPYIDPPEVAAAPTVRHNELTLKERWDQNGFFGLLQNHNWIGPGTQVSNQLPTSKSDAGGMLHDRGYKEIGELLSRGEITEDEADRRIKVLDDNLRDTLEYHKNDGEFKQQVDQHIALTAMKLKGFLEKHKLLSPLQFIDRDPKSIKEHEVAAHKLEEKLAKEHKTVTPPDTPLDEKEEKEGKDYEENTPRTQSIHEHQHALDSVSERLENGEIDEEMAQWLIDRAHRTLERKLARTENPDADNIRRDFEERARDAMTPKRGPDPGPAIIHTPVAPAAPQLAPSGNVPPVAPAPKNFLEQKETNITQPIPGTSKETGNMSIPIIAPTPNPKPTYNAGSMGPRALEGTNIKPEEKLDGLPGAAPVNDVLRLEFTEADSKLVIPSTVDQIRSDIEFDMFSVVRPGFGLGADNKMFAFENIRDQEIIGKEPLFEPRAYDGPTGGVDTVPLCLQSVLPTAVFQKNERVNKLLQTQGLQTTLQTLKGSLNVLGDDYGQLSSVSDRGLNRPPESYLEPVIRIDSRWQRPKLEPGYLSSKRQFRKLYDGLRYPEHMRPHMNMDGGPTMKKARASLEVLI